MKVDFKVVLAIMAWILLGPPLVSGSDASIFGLVLAGFTLAALNTNGVEATVGCTSQGFNTCFYTGNHCDLQDMQGTCPMCTCFFGVGSQPSNTIDGGCIAVQVGLVSAKATCLYQPYHVRNLPDYEKLTSDVEAIRLTYPEVYAMLKSLIHVQPRAIKAGTPVSQISDGQIQVPRIVSGTTNSATSVTPVVSSSPTDINYTVALHESSSTTLQNTEYAPPIATTTRTPTTVYFLRSTYSTLQTSAPTTTLRVTFSVATINFGNGSSTAFLVQTYPQVYYTSIERYTRTFTNTPARITIHLSRITPTASEPPVTTSGVPPSYNILTYGSNTTITTPTLTSPTTATSTSSTDGAVVTQDSGAEIAGLIGFLVAVLLILL